MSVDTETVERIAHLARLTLPLEEKVRMCEEINRLLAFDEQLNEVNIEGVEPLTTVITESLIMRQDKVCAEETVEMILKNAPLTEENFFLVPKVVD